MPTDIFDFWAECPPDARMHPQDEPVFARPFIGNMGFKLHSLPACFAGPLRTAPVVLLYLSPGWRQADDDEADNLAVQARYADRRRGYRPLESKVDHPHHYDWWHSRTKLFGPPEVVSDKIAILNLGAYHSATFDSAHSLAALPSSRVALDWAHELLFPEAMDGKRVVICMRAAEHWGLKPGNTYGKSLYAPATVRGGHMKKQGDHAEIRQGIVDAAKAAMTRPNPLIL